MSKSIVVREDKEIAEGSLSDVAVHENISLAEAFAGAKRVILLDDSGSMDQHDVGADGASEYGYDYGGGKSRHQAAEEQVRRLQREYKGAIALFCFSDEVVFCPDGVPRRSSGLTDMARALRYIKAADDMEIGIDLITDGEPTCSASSVLEIAGTFKTPINGIFIGPAHDRGQNFLRELCAVTGGRYVKTKHVGDFYEDEERLMLTS